MLSGCVRKYKVDFTYMPSGKLDKVETYATKSNILFTDNGTVTSIIMIADKESGISLSETLSWVSALLIKTATKVVKWEFGNQQDVNIAQNPS